MQAQAGSVTSVDVSPNGRTLVTTSDNGKVRPWNVASRRPIGTPLPGPENLNAFAQFAPDGNHVYAASPTAAATAGTSAQRHGRATRARSPAGG